MLLILAGVSISLILDNNGIIQRSSDAKERYGQARKNEQVDLNNASDWIDEVTDNINWEKILKKLEEDPESYKHPDQEDTNPDIGVGTDGKPVNLDLWHYRINNSGTGIVLNASQVSALINPGYDNTNITEEGTIIGKMPQYIWIDEKNTIYPILDVTGTFAGCVDLVIAPEIPSIVTNMYRMFEGCTNLRLIPTIPLGVTNMCGTFENCSSLTIAPVIPSSVTNMKSTFSGCTNLVTAPEIPSSVTDMEWTFHGCTSLITAPKIPSSVTDMCGTFDGCTSLVTAPEILVGVTNMDRTFNNCNSLTMVPVIPSSVINMTSTFWGCLSLTGNLVINANPRSYTYCLSGASTASGTNLVVSGTSTLLDKIIATKDSNSNITKGN